MKQLKPITGSSRADVRYAPPKNIEYPPTRYGPNSSATSNAAHYRPAPADEPSALPASTNTPASDAPCSGPTQPNVNGLSTSATTSAPTSSRRTPNPKPAPARWATWATFSAASRQAQRQYARWGGSNELPAVGLAKPKAPSILHVLQFRSMSNLQRSFHGIFRHRIAEHRIARGSQSRQGQRTAQARHYRRLPHHRPELAQLRPFLAYCGSRKVGCGMTHSPHGVATFMGVTCDE